MDQSLAFVEKEMWWMNTAIVLSTCRGDTFRGKRADIVSFASVGAKSGI